MIITHYNHMHPAGIDPSFVPYSFPSPKSSSVIFKNTTLGPYNNPIPDPTNKPSNYPLLVAPERSYNDPISVSSYVPSADYSAPPSVVPGTLPPEKNSSVTSLVSSTSP